MAAGKEHLHRVQFFEEPQGHASRVAASLAETLAAGGSAGAIARPAVLDAIREALVATGVDLVSVLVQHRLVLVDAEELLASIMNGALPDRTRFDTSIGQLIADLSARGTPTQLYGEMVDLLSERGQIAAALRLEQLWNELGRQHPFSVFTSAPAARSASR